ncbi:AAA family ATPase [Micromonospora sp. NPDC005173]|uniref:AAA family ATPase n=1 Tax=Micromonospora sp. NPDC005173 TaxID=3157165 RepID=UPI00339F3774
MVDPRGLPDTVETRVAGLLSSVNHAAPSIAKYRGLERLLAETLAIDPRDLYAAYISKAANTSVRFNQSDRSRSAIVLVALIDPPSTEPVERTIEALRRYCSKRSGVEVLVFLLRDDKWQFLLALVPREEPSPLLLMAFSGLEYGVSVQTYETGISQAGPVPAQPRRASPQAVPIVVVDPELEPWSINSFPHAYLTRDYWDDFGLKTSFELIVQLEPGRAINVGAVKILRRGQTEGPTELPVVPFTHLADIYCSLGQSHSYYQTLKLLPQAVYRSILTGLRDIVFNPKVEASFRGEEGLRTSLLRTGTAARALEDAKALFRTQARPSPSTATTFTFETTVGGDWFNIDFSFSGLDRLPDRINAIIGYNGTGKTQLLANIARIASGDLQQRAELADKVGRISSEDELRFGKVIAISYSAFDTFALPDSFWRGEESRLAHQKLEESGEVGGYAYCGLRRRADNQRIDTDSPRELKNIDEIGSEFSQALYLAMSGKRRPVLRQVLSIISDEPSIGRLGLNPQLTGTGTDWFVRFDRLSTGHKIVINILVQIIGRIEPRSLVLIDEPESHLHPSLLAALIRALNRVLQEFDSYSIISTHSAVVLQEIPKRFVRILQRYGSRTMVREPLAETFGENVGYLTSNVFHLDSTKTDYHAVLEDLAEDLSLDEIDELFDFDMSTQARSYVLNIKQGRE